MWTFASLLSVVGLLVAALLKLLSSAYSLYCKVKAMRDIPSFPEPPHWFLGHIPVIWKMMKSERKALAYFNYIRTNKIKLVKFWVGPFTPNITIHHCSLVPKALKLPKNRRGYDLLRPWLGDGLLISEGSKWARNRRLLTPAFHYEILTPYIGVYNKCLEVLFSKWSTSARVSDPVKLFESVRLLSLDIILQCSFSFSSDCQSLEHKHPYIQAVQEIVDLASLRFVSVVGRINWLYSLTPTGRKYKNYCKLAHNYSRTVIQNRKKELEISSSNLSMSESELKAKKKGKYLDFLDILLIARDDEGNGLTDQEIQDEVDTFLFEGHDTTTSGMCWTLYCLAKHPEHQEKVREEVRSVLMGREWLEYDDLKELKYTQWCIKEAMRLYPPVFFISRETTEDVELEGYHIPKGIRVGINIRSIQRNSDTWENPDEFDPLRFHPSNCEGRHPFAYIPFSGGQRNCIGQNFALNEERVVIASIVNRFKLSLVEGHHVESAPFIVLRSTNDIQVNLEPLL